MYHILKAFENNSLRDDKPFVIDSQQMDRIIEWMKGKLVLIFNPLIQEKNNFQKRFKAKKNC